MATKKSTISKDASSASSFDSLLSNAVKSRTSGISALVSGVFSCPEESANNKAEGQKLRHAFRSIFDRAAERKMPGVYVSVGKETTRKRDGKTGVYLQYGFFESLNPEQIAKLKALAKELIVDGVIIVPRR